MSFAGIASQMRFDALAVEACRCLERAGVPHVLLKGPTTSRWLYNPPRDYRDVDLLVPASRADEAVQALSRAGVAHAVAGGLGEEAHHSHLLHTSSGLELDLHVTLPSTPVPSANDESRLWRALAPHIQPFELDGAEVPALDLPARFLVIALHALSSPAEGQASEDLRRAEVTSEGGLRSSAVALATELSIEHLFAAALAMIGDEPDGSPLPLEYRLLHRGAAGAYQLHRLTRVPLSGLPRALWKEAFPSVGFMRHSHPGAASGIGLWKAYCSRLGSLIRQTPGQVSILLKERRHAPPP